METELKFNIAATLSGGSSSLEPAEGVITPSRKPFAKGRHETIEARIPVFGIVQSGRVVDANPEDRQRDTAAN